jgi:hypothetical protein
LQSRPRFKQQAPQGAAAGVDQHGGPLHRGQPSNIHQAARVGRQRHVQGQRIGLPKPIVDKLTSEISRVTASAEFNESSRIKAD